MISIEDLKMVEINIDSREPIEYKLQAPIGELVL
jgi:hypothetical protein